MMVNNPNSETETKGPEQILLDLLQQQYDITLQYCNALTNLHNETSMTTTTTTATTTNNHTTNYDDKIHIALAQVLQTTRQLQQHQDQLEQVILLPQRQEGDKPSYTALLGSRRLFDLWKMHVERSQRILQMLHHSQPRWSPSGIPLPSNNNIHANDNGTATFRVALATLRASVETVKEQLRCTTYSSSSLATS